MLTEKLLYKEFDRYKTRALEVLSKGGAEDAMSAAKLACSLAKTYYLCYKDDALEELALRISGALFPKGEVRLPRMDVSAPAGERCVFYDAHATDNVALTQQYLAALVSWGTPFLYLSTRPLAREGPGSSVKSLLRLQRPRSLKCGGV